MDKRRRVLEQMKQNHLTVSTAESCTGGMIAAALTDLAGSSSIFVGGVVSYWTEIKHKIVGVSQETLDQYGAVSPQTAREMAEGVRKIMGSDLGISVTGVAGPDSDDRGNPVGCVYLALADGYETKVYKPEQLGSDRETIRRSAVDFALTLLCEYCDN